MSFILDALKKVEDDKRRGEQHQVAGALNVVGSNRPLSRLVIISVVIVSVSAVLTATLLFMRHTNRLDLAVTGESPAPVAKETPVANAPLSVSVPSSPLARTEKKTSPASSLAASSATIRVTPPARSTPSSPAVLPSALPEPRAAAPEAKPATAFRLVGRESSRLSRGYEPVGEVAGDGTSGKSVGGDGLLPGHFPKLVLQGTSVINGEPVAVINDQRVFEGDHVDGARVMGIEERAVELEIEGFRFKIRL